MQVKNVVAGVALAGLAGVASAASVLDAATLTAVSGGFTDMQDTTIEVVKTFFPYMIGIMAVLFGPKIVSRLASRL